MSDRRPMTAGFTLIELMLVLTILVVVITLAAPSFVDTLDRRRVVDATETLVKQVHQARAVAIETNREISIVFVLDEDAGSWCFGLTDADDCNCFEEDITGADACTIPLAAAVVTLAGADRVLIQADGSRFRGVDLASAPPALRFEPLRGLRADGILPETVEFVSARGRETRVVVNLLGRAGTCSPLVNGKPSVITMRPCPELDD